jgi:predicted acylesterase/phospholipase RssA
MTIMSTAFGSAIIASLLINPKAGPRPAPPRVINVGLPVDASRQLVGVDGVGTVLRAKLEALSGSPGHATPWTINLATGSDYQILEWLSQGAIDAGVVPDLSAAVLGDDVREVPLSDPERQLLLPEQRIAPHAVRSTGSTGSWTDDGLIGETEFNAFLEGIVEKNTGSGGRPRRILVASSHLSSTGFLWPAARAAERFATVHARSQFFNVKDAWDRLFTDVRFGFDCATAQSCAEAAAEGQPGDTIFIVFPGERSHDSGAASVGTGTFREHLVLSVAAANRLGLHLDDLTAAKPRGDVATLLTALDGPDSIFKRGKVFGTRQFAFTVGETLALLRTHPYDDDEIALVLPGGGVKAAYQTWIVDDLYRRGLLSNVRKQPALWVRTVIGTSGGALLGYFVSQLTDPPIPLFDLLWAPNGLLRSTDIFGWTDLPRYVSLVAIFGLLCCVLFTRSLVLACWSGKRLPPAAGPPKVRWRLLVALFLFVVAPVFIRESRGKVEHVPEIEGVFYLIMTILVMFADQVVVREEPGAASTSIQPRPLKRSIGFCVVTGVLLCAIGLLLDRQGIPFAFAYCTMAGLVVAALVPWRPESAPSKKPTLPWKEWLGESSLALIGGLVVCWLYSRIHGPRLPYLVSGMGLLVASVLRFRYREREWQVRTAATLAALTCVAALCWTGSFGGLLPIGMRSLFVTLGLVLFLAAAVFWAVLGNGYSARTGGAIAGFAVVQGHSLVVLGGIVVLVTIFHDSLTPLEFTSQYWWMLATFSLLLGIAIVLLPAGRLRSTVDWLASDHPNGWIVQARYLRMLVLSIFGLVWWNAVVAPAVYGNQSALAYRVGATERFNTKMKREWSKTVPFVPTTRFVAPTNLLEEQHGTRYFLFLPEGDSNCNGYPREDLSGAKWFVYRTTPGGRSDTLSVVDFPGDVAFASGSPFPLLAAHGIQFAKGVEPCNCPRDRESEGKTYVDGGYTNNIPVDAAHTLGASRVLIVESSNPDPAESPSGGLLSRLWKFLPGELIQHSERLPAYFFERSQQMDRLGRRGMFVASLAPWRYERQWPPLFDFRGVTVEGLRNVAETDLTRRVGSVESWGLPAFRSITIAPAASR